MSRLQGLINKLIQVIVSYHKTQTSKTQLADPTSNKSAEEQNENLLLLITEATIKYKTRRPLLDYFFYVITTIKPLIERSNPLTSEEEKFITATLVSLLTNTKRLLDTYQTSNVNVKYGETIIQMPGFKRGAAILYTLCNTGQVILKELFNPLKFNNTSDFGPIVQQLLIEHQNPLKKIEQLEVTLIKEKKETNNELIFLKKELETERECLQLLEKENKNLTQTIGLLAIDKVLNSNIIASLKIENEMLKTRKGDLSKQIDLQSEEICSLREENSTLRNSIPKHPPKKFPFNSYVDYTAFGQHPFFSKDKSFTEKIISEERHLAALTPLSGDDEDE